MSAPKSFLAPAGRVALGVLAAAWLQLAVAAPSGEIEMSADRWEANGTLAFAGDAAHPHGVMTVRQGGAILKGVTFASGTIEYDIDEATDNQGIAGIWFRQQGTESAENVYLRVDSDCPASIECLQYAPVSHGQVQWETFPQFQAAAPVHASGWNHVRLVISGQRMNVFVNGQARPALQVGELAGDVADGAIQLRGDARFANLRVVPGATDGLAPEPVPDPSATDGRFVRHWRISPVATLARGDAPALAAMPPASAAWEPLDAERGGFVNLARRHATAHGAPDLAWLKTTIVSDRAQTKHVRIGLGHEVWLWVGGRLVYADRNVYYPASGRKPPLGRVALENGAFELPLAAGVNELVIATSDDLGTRSHYGWGFEMRLDDIDGVRLAAAAPAGM